MSVPPLRRPKLLSHQPDTRKKTVLPDVQYVIITLKDNQKLVVSSDAYHGIITAGEVYKCVFCGEVMELDSKCKEEHQVSSNHKKVLEKYPHVSDYSENLIRELSNDSLFCTICNVVVSNINSKRHIYSDAHAQELQKARIRADTYKPF